MNAEAILDDTIDPWSAAPVLNGDAEKILLTGATGYLGAFLLAELAAQTPAAIYCLVRASSEPQGRERLRSNLRSYGLPANCADRAIIVPGDLQQALLGLTPCSFDKLAEEVDLVLHCGASVKWTYPYASLKDANVGGTHEVLRMAASRRLKPVHFISTVGVFSSLEYPGDVVLENEPLDQSGPLAVGYAQSKWIAEKLVTLAGCRGLPICIYRPNIAWHSETGAFNAADHLVLMMRGCLEMGSVPDLDWEVAGAAVDYVALAVVHLAQQSESIGRVFHLVAPRPLPWNSLAEHLVSRRGLRRVPIGDWIGEFQEQVLDGRRRALTALLPLFSEAIIGRVRLPRFDDRTTMQHLHGTGIHPPDLNAAMLDRVLDRITCWSRA
jgi:thioester reductase-like protein